MKESINYWTVGCHRQEPVKQKRPPRLSECRYLSAHGAVGDYSAHCMIEDQKTALDFAKAIAPDLAASTHAEKRLVIEPVHILISPHEKARFLRRITEQSKVVKGLIIRRALEML